MGQPRPLFHLFSSFQTRYKFCNKYVNEKRPSSIRCQDSNSRLLEHESPPITTRPGLVIVYNFRRTKLNLNLDRRLLVESKKPRNVSFEGCNCNSFPASTLLPISVTRFGEIFASLATF